MPPTSKRARSTAMQTADRGQGPHRARVAIATGEDRKIRKTARTAIPAKIHTDLPPSRLKALEAIGADFTPRDPGENDPVVRHARLYDQIVDERLTTRQAAELPGVNESRIRHNALLFTPRTLGAHSCSKCRASIVWSVRDSVHDPFPPSGASSMTKISSLVRSSWHARPRATRLRACEGRRPTARRGGARAAHAMSSVPSNHR